MIQRKNAVHAIAIVLRYQLICSMKQLSYYQVHNSINRSSGFPVGTPL